MLIYRTIITRGPLCAAGCSLSGGQLGRFLSAASDGALASADAAAAGPAVIPVTSSAPSVDLEGDFNSTFRRRPHFRGSLVLLQDARVPAGDGLPVYRRGESGSKAAEKLRREGKVPGVIFSQVRMRSLPVRCGPVLVM